MADDKTGMDKRAKDSMSVAPPDPDSDDAKAKRHKEKSIEQRLDRNPQSQQAQLDEGLDESMAASDPPATTQPAHSSEPPESSDYDEEAERKRKAKE